jgi:hypothetical protein
VLCLTNWKYTMGYMWTVRNTCVWIKLVFFVCYTEQNIIYCVFVDNGRLSRELFRWGRDKKTSVRDGRGMWEEEVGRSWHDTNWSCCLSFNREYLDSANNITIDKYKRGLSSYIEEEIWRKLCHKTTIMKIEFLKFVRKNISLCRITRNKNENITSQIIN